MVKLHPKRTSLLLLLSVAAVYGNTLINGFTFDDARAVVHNSDIRSWHNFFNILLTTRGVRTITYLLDYSLFELNPFPYHIHSLLWQLAAVLLAYRLLARLLTNNKALIIAVFIFALHPLHVEAVANISNRKELICFVFFLSALLSYMNIFSAVNDRKKIQWGALSALYFLLALKSKEVAVTLPAILVIYELLYVQKNKRVILHLRFIWFKLAILLLALFLSFSKFSSYILLSSNVYYSHYRLSGELMGYNYIINNTLMVFFYYLRNFLFPINLLPDYYIPARGSLADLTFFLSLSFIVLYLYMIFLMYKKNRTICFGLLWFLINYLAISPINTPIYPLCDRYLYLPSLGLSMVAAIGLEKGFAAAKGIEIAAIWRALIAALLVCMALLTFNYNRYWESDSILWHQTLNKNPESRIGRINLAIQYARQGKLDEAEVEILKMGEIDPRDKVGKQAKMLLSEIYYRKYEKERAFEIYRSIVAKVDHANPNITYSYIMTFAGFFKESGLYEEALKSYRILEEKKYKKEIASAEISRLKGLLEGKKSEDINRLKRAIMSNPEDISSRVSLGAIYFNMRSYDKAEREFTEALKINGGIYAIRFNLGLIYQQTERFQEAAREFEQALLLTDNVPPGLHNKLGLAYMRLNRDKEAIDQFLRAINLQGAFAPSYLNLGNAYMRTGNDLEAIAAYKAFLKYWKGDQYYRQLVESKLKDLLK